MTSRFALAVVLCVGFATHVAPAQAGASLDQGELDRIAAFCAQASETEPQASACRERQTTFGAALKTVRLDAMAYRQDRIADTIQRCVGENEPDYERAMQCSGFDPSTRR